MFLECYWHSFLSTPLNGDTLFYNKAQDCENFLHFRLFEFTRIQVGQFDFNVEISLVNYGPVKNEVGYIVISFRLIEQSVPPLRYRKQAHALSVG